MQGNLQISTDRFGFALFIALILHAMLLLGLQFAPGQPPANARVLDITLALTTEALHPDTFDFIAERNQQALGEPNPTTELPLKAAETTLGSAPASGQSAADTIPRPLSPEATARPPLVTDLAQFRRPSLDFTDIGVPRLERVQRLSQVSAAASPEANYLRSWQRKIETIGNLNYPDAARRLGIYGQLKLLVVVEANGGLRDVRVLVSSGEPVLDQAAENIVRLAAPFAPFSQELLQSTDVLEIVRTWQFRKNARSVSVTR